jgi:hypothetical protein
MHRRHRENEIGDEIGIQIRNLGKADEGAFLIDGTAHAVHFAFVTISNDSNTNFQKQKKVPRM